MCFTFLEAVIFILKHATFLHLSGLSSESAITHAGLHYQEANIDFKIQECLATTSTEQSVTQFAGFIMATDFGLFILAYIKRVSHQVYAESVNPDMSAPS